MNMAWIMGLVCLAVLLWRCTVWLRGPDMAAFDAPVPGKPAPIFQARTQAAVSAQERGAVLDMLDGLHASLKSMPRWRHLGYLRNYMDNMTAPVPLNASFTPVDAGGVAAEWVLAPGARSDVRTLYIHGGAWIMGSPRSHRVITTRFSELTGGAVLAIDYRLMPEHSRMAGVDDCRTAYRWMLDHGPQGAASADKVFVAGDSAGGNLTLSLIAWVRDQKLRAPNAAVALSPATDGTLGSPSLRSNLATDPMLGPLFGRLAAVPRAVLLWVAFVRDRMRPCNPVVSPLFGDLAGLPPILIHASASEMLHDDCLRYANKAAAAGTPVTVQTWGEMMHVWHIFYPQLTEARDGFDEIGKFLQG